MRWAYGIAWVVAVAIGGSATAQGLGEAAAKEKKRREAQKQAEAKEKGKAKTFTDEDLQNYTGESSGGASSVSPAEESAPPTDAKPTAPAAGPRGPDESFKRTRAAMIKAELEQCQASLGAARAAYKAAEANEPSVDYPAGYVVSQAEARDRVREIKTANLRAAKARVDGAEQNCAAIEDAARRENIPPGWIR